jgi:imidazolonepropionase
LLPAEAFNAASVNAAYAVGLGGRIGSIEVGKNADLIIADTNDYRELAYEFGASCKITVIKAGKLVE